MIEINNQTSSPVMLLLLRVKDAIESYGSSVTSLAQKSGVDAKTIRRIVSLNYIKFPNVETVLKILSITCRKKSVVDIGNFYQGAILIFLKKSFPHYFSKKLSSANIHNDIIKEIKDYISYQIICICDNNVGEPIENLVKTISVLIMKKNNNLLNENLNIDNYSSFIPIAKKRIDHLLANGTLLIENNRIKTSITNIEIPFNIVVKYFGESIQFCESNQWDVSSFFSRIKFSNSSKEDAEEAVKLMFKGYSDAAKILDRSTGNDFSLQIIASVESMEFNL